MAVDLWLWFVANKNLIWIASFLIVIGLTADNWLQVLPGMTKKRRFLAGAIIFITTSLLWMYADGGVDAIISRIAGVSVGIAVGTVIALDKILERLK